MSHRIRVLLPGVIVLTALMLTVAARPQQAIVSPKLGYTPVCLSTGSPAPCQSDPAGAVVIAGGSQTVVVNTSAVTTNSQIFVQFDESLAPALGITQCDTNASNAEANRYFVSARTANSSFTIKAATSITGTVPVCLSYLIVN